MVLLEEQNQGLFDAGTFNNARFDTVLNQENKTLLDSTQGIITTVVLVTELRRLEDDTIVDVESVVLQPHILTEEAGLHVEITPIKTTRSLIRVAPSNVESITTLNRSIIDKNKTVVQTTAVGVKNLQDKTLALARATTTATKTLEDKAPSNVEAIINHFLNVVDQTQATATAKIQRLRELFDENKMFIPFFSDGGNRNVSVKSQGTRNIDVESEDSKDVSVESEKEYK